MKRLKKPMCFMITFCMIFGMVMIPKPKTVNAAEIVYPARITDNGVRLRKSPSTSSTILGLMYNNDLVFVYKNKSASEGKGQWYYVERTGNVMYGWVSKSYVEILDAP